MKKRIILLIIFGIILFGLGISYSNASEIKSSNQIIDLSQNIDTSTNFFTQPLNEEKIVINDEKDLVISQGYQKIAENEFLILYRYDEKMAIAIYDKANGYMWYSSYKNIDSMNFSDAVNAKINSGISIEYYDANGKSISTLEMSITSKKANMEISYEKIDNGFLAHIKFGAVGISFDVSVTIDGYQLSVNIPYMSIKEETVGKLQPKNYQLKAIYVFPYFGCENYSINGYAFIPDGSGALIRYQNVDATAAYLKKVYGNDEGIYITSKDATSHIVADSRISLPIYGINHGYQQAAFLCEITSGDGSAELHSYPYNYKNIPLNTTFFKLGVRDTFMVSLSSSSMTLINEDPYPNDYAVKYSFLSNQNASYVGMAKEYATHLGLDQTIEEEDIPLHLNILGLDYKKGLFGKKYIDMTSYKEALNIVKDLKNNNVFNMQISYLGWNNGGYFNNGAINAKAASLLGGKKALVTLNNYLDDNDIPIDYTINPLITNNYGFGKDTIKRINLSAFDTSVNSSLEQEAYYISPSVLSETITKKQKKYQKLGIDSFNIDHLTDSFSYRYHNKVYYRFQMIDIIEKELSSLSKYNLSTTNPNAYLLKYLTNYYEIEYESSKFIYETDSIPFISIMLSGYLNLFSSNINYISDYHLFALRMIEYNIYPSFILTKEEAYDLRYTNFEYLNSTEYRLWKDLIIEIYQMVNDVLKEVRGSQIINHRYLAKGVASITYSNGKTIYVNYNDEKYQSGSITIEPQSWIIGGSYA